MDNLYIVIPAYNEQDNIREIIREWHPIVEKIGNNSKLVIFNDGSKDNTYAAAQAMTAECPCLEVIDKKNSGHGPTCLFGYRYALQQGATYVFQTDSDGQTSAEEFGTFWDNREKYDFVIGVRRQREDGFSRIVITKVLKLVLFLIFGVGVTDANTPYRLMKAETLKKYMADIPSDFFLANVLLSVLAVKRQAKILWLDITFRPRQAGENSINVKKIIKIGLKAVGSFWGLARKEKQLHS